MCLFTVVSQLYKKTRELDACVGLARTIYMHRI